MTNGQNSGDSNELTVDSVDSAASAFAHLLSSEEEHPENQNAATPDEESTDDTDVENEPVDEVDESTSDEVDPDTQDDEEDSDESSDEPDTPKTRKIKVDGEEIEVTDEELEKGYSRTADYTRKTQKLAEERKAFEGESVAVREERKQLADQLTQLKTAIESLTPAEPDWDKLREENPEEFPLVWAEWQQHKERLDKLSAKQKEALEKVQADQRKHLEEYVRNEQQALLTALPEWKDSEVAKREAAEMGAFAKSLGYSDEDVNNVVDHRLVLLLRKAMLYDKAQKKKPVIRQKIDAVRTATPGPAQKATGRKSEFKRRSQRLRESGSVQDAAALFELLDD